MEEAKKHPIVFDKDCQEFSPSMIRHLRVLLFKEIVIKKYSTLLTIMKKKLTNSLSVLK